VDKLYGYCCKPSQRTGNRLVYLKHQFQRSSCVIFFQKSPYISSKSTQRKILKKTMQQVEYVKKRRKRWGLNPHPDGRRVEDTKQNCLTNITSCSSVYNIEYILYLKHSFQWSSCVIFYKVPTFLPNQLNVKY
jgi:hypothetical protein